MSSNTNIGNTPVNQGYVQLIHTGETGGIDGTLRTLYDGDGTASDLQIASNKVKVSTELYIGSKTATEFIQDIVGDMFTTGSYTNITTTYDDTNGNIDLSASGEVTLTGSQTLSNKTLASPAFTGDIDFSDASTPKFTITDTTNTVKTEIRSQDSTGYIGTTSDHNLGIIRNGVGQITLFGAYTMHNNGGNDIDFRAKDSSGNVVFKVNAGTSKTEISTLLLDSVSISAIQTGSESFADNDTSLMTSAAINDKIGTEVASLVDSAPSSLDTLNELAAALGDDANFSTTVTNNIATKLAKASNLSDLASASTARSNLGLGTGAELNTAAVSDGASTLATGNAIYDHVTSRISGLQASNAFLDDIAGITGTGSGGNLVGADHGKYITFDFSSAGFILSSSQPIVTSGTTQDGLLTYHSSTTATVESNLTFDGTNLDIAADDSKLRLGAGNDGQIYVSSDNLIIRNVTADKDVILQSDNGSGGETAYLTLDGSATKVQVDKNMVFSDNVQAQFGGNVDLRIYSDDSNSYIDNENNDLIIQNDATDKDIILKSDNGSGGLTNYIQLDGSEVETVFNQKIKVEDSKKFAIGSGRDFSIEHDGSHNYMKLSNGNLYFRDQSNNNIFQIYREGGGIQLSEGDLKIPATSKLYFDGGGHTYIHEESADNLQFQVGGKNMFRLHEGNSEAVFNDGGFALDLRVEGDTDTNLFFVDGSADRVGIGTNSPSTKLEVAGGFRISETGDGTDYLEIGVGADATTGGTSVLTNNGSMVFGTTDSSSLIVRTNNTEAMRIDTSQNVGIGNTSPDATFHVGDNSSSFTLGTTSGNSIDLLKLETDSTNANQLIFSSERVSDGSTWTSTRERIRRRVDSSNMGYIQFGSSFDATNAHMISFGEVGVGDYMGITGDGKVGIGTASPAEKLQVNGNLKIGDAGNITTFTMSGNYPVVYFDDVETGAYIANNANGLFIGKTNTPSAANDLIKIDLTNGNVGIGTTSPTNFGSGFTNLQISGSTAGSVQTTDSTNSATAELFTSGGVGYVGTRSNHSFRIKSNDTTAMTIDTSQRVGIGTASPAVDLHILDTGGHSQLRIETDNASSGAYLELESTTNKYQIYNVGGDLGIDESGVATRFIIKDSTGNVGIGTNSPAEKLHVVGNGYFTADVVAYYSSDKRLKDNIKTIENAVDKVSKIRGVEFDWNNKQDTYQGHDIGVVAQEVEKVLPEITTTRDDGYKAVKYEKIVPLLIEAIKEQQKQIEELKNG